MIRRTRSIRMTGLYDERNRKASDYVNTEALIRENEVV